jgi:tight adherence protein C
MGLIFEKLSDPNFMGMLLAAIGAAATVVTFAMPFMENDNLARRMKAVADEREKIRFRERSRLNKGQEKISLRQAPKVYMKNVVEQFKVEEWLGVETAKKQLVKAGFRGQQAEVAFLFFRLIVPIVFMVCAVFYVFAIDDAQRPMIMRLGIIVAAIYAGIKAPEVYLSNVISKRQADIRRSWPDGLDLLLICVESGMSIEQAFRKVSQEIGVQSVPLSEELTLATAELSYLPDRKFAYENLAERIGLEPVRSAATALIQAERYGTPLGQALRVLAQESRDQRMTEAEKKAAALPPKLTVPMIVFFLPVLFVVLLTPALTQVFGWK